MKNKQRKYSIFNVKFKKELFLLTFKVVRWLCSSTGGTSLPLHHYEALCIRLQDIYDKNGPLYTIQYIKAIRGNFYNYLSNNVLRNPIARSTSDGIPVILGDLIPLVRGRHMRAIALILTILTCTRSLKIKIDPDLSTITQPIKGDVPDLSKHMGSFWRSLGYRPITAYSLPRKLKVKSEVYRLANGPNGRSLNTALLDLKYMPQTLRASLSKMSPKVGALISKLSAPLFSDFFESKFKEFDNTKKCCRRLSTFPDKEGKTRVIGVLDHYSQITLKPLHTWMSKVLSKIKQDCTLDQGKFKNLMSTNNSDLFYSVDLSAATDRFPIKLISDLLKYQLPFEYVNAWEDVMVGTPFRFQGKDYSYSTGNPMGAYSSFNSFAITHHYLIYYCCKELGVSWKKLPYALLGDDIVIGDSKVGEMYMSVIKSLHVEYSLAKTHKSKDFYEFAKRIIYMGEEITPFPISSLKENRKTISGFSNLLLEQQCRGWHFTAITSSAAMFYSSVLHLPSRLVKQRVMKVERAVGVLSLVRGLQNGETFLNEMAITLQLPLPHINMEICKNIISNIAVEVFSSSTIHTYFSTSDHSSLPLFQVVSRWRKEWEKYVADHMKEESSFNILKTKTLFSDTPIYLAATAIYKEYEEMMSRIEKIDSTGSDWSYYMRNLTLPVTTKAIMEGGQFATFRSIDRFSDLIEERLRVLALYPQLLEM